LFLKTNAVFCDNKVSDEGDVSHWRCVLEESGQVFKDFKDFSGDGSHSMSNVGMEGIESDSTQQDPTGGRKIVSDAAVRMVALTSAAPSWTQSRGRGDKSLRLSEGVEKHASKVGAMLKEDQPALVDVVNLRNQGFILEKEIETLVRKEIKCGVKNHEDLYLRSHKLNNSLVELLNEELLKTHVEGIKSNINTAQREDGSPGSQRWGEIDRGLFSLEEAAIILRCKGKGEMSSKFRAEKVRLGRLAQ